MKHVILISAKQGGGKSTLQNALVNAFDNRGIQAYAINFADAIYKMHDFCIDYLKQYGIDRKLVKDGPLLQVLGTEWGRNTIGENIWVDVLKGRIAACPTGFQMKDQVFIVGDCRFKNELDGFPEAYKVRLNCDREVRKARCSMWRNNETHPSEIDLDDYLTKFDALYDSSKASVGEMVRDIVENYKAKVKR